MSIEDTLAERGARYGAFIDHARICQALKDVMTGTPGWGRLDPDMKQALEVVQDKIARILNGDPKYLDNWHDMQGYPKLVEDRLTGEAAKANGVTDDELPECTPWSPLEQGILHATAKRKAALQKAAKAK